MKSDGRTVLLPDLQLSLRHRELHLPLKGHRNDNGQGMTGTGRTSDILNAKWSIGVADRRHLSVGDGEQQNN